jgi:hypothetical protein
MGESEVEAGAETSIEEEKGASVFVGGGGGLGDGVRSVGESVEEKSMELAASPEGDGEGECSDATDGVAEVKNQGSVRFAYELSFPRTEPTEISGPGRR